MEYFPCQSIHLSMGFYAEKNVKMDTINRGDSNNTIRNVPQHPIKEKNMLGLNVPFTRRK